MAELISEATKGKPARSIAAAELYELWTLDCVVDVAQAISLDFVARPRHYRRVSDRTAAVLEQLKARLGHDPDWPDGAQRAAIFGAVFGSGNGDRSAQFHQASAGLRAAAAAFAERTFDTGVAMLRQRFRDSVIALRAHLSTLDGQAVDLGLRQTRAIFERARSVFADPQVAATFGLPPAPKGDWPLAGVYDGDGAYLVEEVSQLLRPESRNPSPERRFVVRQRVATYGRATLIGVADDSHDWDSDDRIDSLIANAYSWMAAALDLERA